MYKDQVFILTILYDVKNKYYFFILNSNILIYTKKNVI
jgi:hypothetical protein